MRHSVKSGIEKRQGTQPRGVAHYNYFRDYDPAIGRYIESDPIGLRGGLNTFVYVNGSPLTQTDAEGLAPSCEPCRVIWERCEFFKCDGSKYEPKGGRLIFFKKECTRRISCFPFFEFEKIDQCSTRGTSQYSDPLRMR